MGRKVVTPKKTRKNMKNQKKIRVGEAMYEV